MQATPTAVDGHPSRDTERPTQRVGWTAGGGTIGGSRLELGFSMADAWVYIDESQAPHAEGTEAGQPFWLGALITEKPIDQNLIGGALSRLGADPDACGNSHDQATLARGYFHASEDSKNAHSWICRAIVDGPLVASFSATQWFFGREDSAEFEGVGLHRLTALVSASMAFQDDFDCVHVFIANRDGSFAQRDLDEWPAYCKRTQLEGVVHNPAIPARFPVVDAALVEAAHPGVQVCDFVLWAAQRSRPERLIPTGNDDWVRRLRLDLWASGSVENSAFQRLLGKLGEGVDRSIHPPAGAPIPRSVVDISDPERWELVEEIAVDVHRAKACAKGSPRIGHVVHLLADASAQCNRTGLEGRDLERTLSDLMEAFLLVCDTLPVYVTTDGAAWARAAEKRSLAAFFLRVGGPLWVPDDFSLVAADLDVRDLQRQRLQATTKWARRIRATLQPLLDAHGDRVHFRPSSTAVTVVGLLPDRPQRGKSGITNLDRLVADFEPTFAAHCRDIEHGRVTGEKALQSYIIRDAQKNARKMAAINAASLGNHDPVELVFVTDEIPLPVEGGEIVCDILALRRDGRRSTPVLLELKDSRMLTRLVEQVEGYAALIDEHPDLFAELFGALLGEAVTFDGPTEKWIVWPAAGAGPDRRAEELRSRGIRVVGYEVDGDGYRFTVGSLGLNVVSK